MCWCFVFYGALIWQKGGHETLGVGGVCDCIADHAGELMIFRGLGCLIVGAFERDDVEDKFGDPKLSGLDERFRLFELCLGGKEVWHRNGFF